MICWIPLSDPITKSGDLPHDSWNTEHGLTQGRLLANHSMVIEEIQQQMNRADTPSRSQIRQSVQKLLSQSPAFRQVNADKQHQMAQHMVVVVDYLASNSDDRASNLRPPSAESVAQDLLQAVDFPDFVAGLIKGVFDAVVGASIAQMEAYAKLFEEVAQSVEQYEENCASEDRAKRQHLLVEMMLLGINRIVVTSGRITAP